MSDPCRYCDLGTRGTHRGGCPQVEIDSLQGRLDAHVHIDGAHMRSVADRRIEDAERSVRMAYKDMQRVLSCVADLIVASQALHTALTSMVTVAKSIDMKRGADE